MTTALRDERTAAEELEGQATQYPDERGEILLEAAKQWECAGDTDRAAVLRGEVLELGGERAGYARFELAESCFNRGDEDAARAHLDALEQADPESRSGPAELVAELLEERGEHQAALAWFDRALGHNEVSRLLSDPEAVSIGTAMTLFGRQRCRNRLGLPADELDRAADVAERRRQEWAELMQNAAGATRSRPEPTEMIVWPRAELARAAERWPEVFAADVDQHCAGVERWLRELSEQQAGTRTMLIVGHVDAFERHLQQTGGDPRDESVRQAYAARARDLGHTLAWPPGRNQPCWCGSARKYKKCCGAPGGS